MSYATKMTHPVAQSALALAFMGMGIVVAYWAGAWIPWSVALIVVMVLTMAAPLFVWGYARVGGRLATAVIWFAQGIGTAILGFATLYWKLGLLKPPHTGWIECVWFSVLAWTTSGYGTMQPLDRGIALASCQMLLGYIFMAFSLGVLGAAVMSESSQGRKGELDRRRGDTES